MAQGSIFFQRPLQSVELTRLASPVCGCSCLLVSGARIRLFHCSRHEEYSDRLFLYRMHPVNRAMADRPGSPCILTDAWCEFLVLRHGLIRKPVSTFGPMAHRIPFSIRSKMTLVKAEIWAPMNGPVKCDDQHDRHDLRHEGQRDFLNLGQRLDESDADADYHGHQNDGRGCGRGPSRSRTARCRVRRLRSRCACLGWPVAFIDCDAGADSNLLATLENGDDAVAARRTSFDDAAGHSVGRGDASADQASA